MKILYVTLLLFTFIFFVIILVLEIFVFDAKDKCLDAQVCAEGLQLNGCYSDGSGCIISEKVCDEIGRWDSQKRVCNIRKR
ncbi:MAG: hypothetical protein LBU87_05435 [Lactobacillales bacterium]|jgi:preprotein translocase subunit SecG|nr:hypothetical protein [Lactobacillales bacterium]